MSFANPFLNTPSFGSSSSSALRYLGTWNATTNSPTLTSSVGTLGDFYIVSVAGTTDLNGITDWQVGDWVLFNGSVWQKIDNSNNDALLKENNLSDVADRAESVINLGLKSGIESLYLLSLAAGSIISGSTNENINITPNGTGSIVLTSTSQISINGEVDMGGKLYLAANGVDPLEAVTVQQLSSVAGGISPIPDSTVATTANLSSAYNNGTAGVGATLTNNSTQASLVIDGYTLLVNDIVVVKNQSDNTENGVYKALDVGSISTDWQLERVSYFDDSSEMHSGALTVITNGSTLIGSSWFLNQSVTTVGTDPVIFSQFSSSTSLFLLKTNNLSDLSSVSTALTNLELMDGSKDLLLNSVKIKETSGSDSITLAAPALAASYTLTLPVDDGSSGQVLSTNGSGVTSWVANGTGNVVGPASATDNAITRFDSTTGKLIQNSLVIIDDLGGITGATSATIGSSISLSGSNSIATGANHSVTGPNSACVGGDSNIIGALNSGQLGGAGNDIQGQKSGGVGGNTNTITNASYDSGFVGGSGSTISGDSSAIIAGISCEATASNTIAGGNRAKANHANTFIWADGTAADYATASVNTFNVRASSGAFFSNDVTSGANIYAVKGAIGTSHTISGTNSFATGDDNTASGNYSASIGGVGNVAAGADSVTLGGLSITATGGRSGIVGGNSNAITANGTDSFIGGGNSGSIDAIRAGILAGNGGSISGARSAILAGTSCAAVGTDSVAAGNRAKAANNNTFVFADGTAADFQTTVTNCFIIRASNGVGIGTATPATTALLDISSTTKGFIGPRMTTTQVNAIATPAEALEAYDLTTHQKKYYNGTSWIAIGAGDVAGPASATANAVARFDSTTGKLIKNSVVIISDLGAITSSNYSTGIAHFDSSGNITSSSIVNADIDAAAAIVDTKLATIATALKVSNSATTATSVNTNSAIVARDGSGNFAAGTITASLTGHASLDLSLTGGTVTGPIIGSSTTAAIFRLNSVTTTQMNAIASPQFGDILADSTTSQAMFYNGSAWVILG